MGVSPFQTAMEAVVNPLAFAAANDFAHLDRVRDLPGTVCAAATRVLALAIPRDARSLLQLAAKTFSAPLEGEELAKAVRRQLRTLAPLADPAWCAAALARPAAALPGVGPKRGELLARRGMRTVCDVLFRLPSRYDDRRSLVDVGALEVGRRATFVARVRSADFVHRGGRARFRRTFEAEVSDDTGSVNLTWFRGGESIARDVRKGATLLVTGDVKRYRFSKQLLHPEIELLDDESDAEEVDLASLRRVVPDYSAAEGVHPRALRRIVAHAVEQYADLVAGQLPPSLVRERQLPEAPDALRELHAPGLHADVEALRNRSTRDRERLALEELYLLQVGLALRRARWKAESGIAVAAAAEPGRELPAKLPFELTGAQRRVWREIRADLARARPMNRLLQGDVGSGKTAVAYLAAVAVAESGYQTALMAPTELLAEQHERTLRRLAEAEDAGRRLRIERLTASLARPEAGDVKRRLAAGAIDLVVGTHALLQSDVRLERLALAVVDEQHRFGVEQRAALAARREGGRLPHTLVMTATPIPRTLALTLYGDLDLSVIDALPPGRRPVTTALLREGEGQRVVDAIRETVRRGEQVYVVYPLVEESEKLDLRAASESAERIRAHFPDLRVDLVHGRLDAAARAEAMARFERGETQVLVSTTVIEVGVDVPNATLMVVEHAERFGLAQLHQLRGRVGRATRPGTCLLIERGEKPGAEACQKNEGSGPSEELAKSEARLRALLATADGFAIADADLAIRGPGEFLGTHQHGPLRDLRIADLVRDTGLVALARDVAEGTVAGDPTLQHTPELARAVRERWGEKLELAGVG